MFHLSVLLTGWGKTKQKKNKKAWTVAFNSVTMFA